MYALDVNRLTVSYFDTHALADVSVRLPVASLIGIIGPNGAGKSTFLKAILGLIPARIEQLRVLDQPLEAVRSRDRLGFSCACPRCRTDGVLSEARSVQTSIKGTKAVRDTLP